MSLSATLSALATGVREYPVAALLELGSLAVCVLLFVGTVVALASGSAAPGREGYWPAIVAVGAAFVLFWTVAVPLYERRSSGR